MSPSKINRREKLCPRCGNIFTCTGDQRCWCNNHQISAALQRYMALMWKDCLCENCFRELLSSQA
ncbi:MAG: cysteine-rich CWC family protein [Bacteroidales bacterium]